MKPERSPGAEERLEIELITRVFLKLVFPTCTAASSSEGGGVAV